MEQQAPKSKQLIKNYQINIHPNKMSYTDDSGVYHEIYLPIGQFHRAVELCAEGNWEELNNFPVWEKQHYTEADYAHVTDGELDEGDGDCGNDENNELQKHGNTRQNCIVIPDDEDVLREMKTSLRRDARGRNNADVGKSSAATSEWIYISDDEEDATVQSKKQGVGGETEASCVIRTVSPGI
ncbi:hypothetical protein QQS21_000062 [Conoideocrella luteorostrata]|uniref:Uncharacterized protein n=1 Tax=Conoideocrella luteorostrata TaxID=1105319 RepID=A0AAJ0G4A0_9HYPO|nr:hypothetical protein QQS21_000062 [Conoideocrella luteorostrata]